MVFFFHSYFKGVLGHVDIFSNQEHRMIQVLFPNNDAVFQDNCNAPIPQLELLSHGLKSLKVNFNTFAFCPV
jgi:hypothetical protein